MLGPRDLWYKDTVVHALTVETFQDSSGDGIGDFAGSSSRIDYLLARGIPCVRLLPSHASPDREHRYDVVTRHAGEDEGELAGAKLPDALRRELGREKLAPLRNRDVS